MPITQRKAPLPRLPVPRAEYIPLEGGLDLVTPALRAQPGMLRAAQNYEADINGGYRRTMGYERFDGQAKPSAAQYARLDVNISGSFSAGDTVTGVTSGASGVIVTGGVVSATQDYLVLTKLAGTPFTSGEDLQVSAVTEGTAAGVEIVDGAATVELDAIYNNAAADVYRPDIAAVPGAGSILGIEVLGSTVYAWRNNTGATLVDIYKSSSSGWVKVPYGERIDFTDANASVDEGDSLTQGGAAATIKRVVVQTGTLSSGTNTGILIIHTRTGGNFGAGAASSTGGGALTLDAIQTAIAPAINGRYETIVVSFDSTKGQRIYGVDKVNTGFEFDGTDYSYTPIETGMAADSPDHVAFYENHLFYSFGSSVQHSGLGTPYEWAVIQGAGEFNVGGTVTAMKEEPAGQGDGALAIYEENHIHVLYGKTALAAGTAGDAVADGTWTLMRYQEEAGAREYTVQTLGVTHAFDNRGLIELRTVQAFGNFKHATASRLIQPWIDERHTLTVASCIAREKSQYRVFFSDNYALYVTMDGRAKQLGMMPQLLSHKVKCVTSREDSSGSEVIYFGSDTGMVYQMEKGTSFDGENINAELALHYNYFGSPLQKKRFYGGVLEVEGQGYSEFSFTYELGYASTAIPQPLASNKIIALSIANWDASTWDAFYWDGLSLMPSTFDMHGSAENMSLVIRSGGDYFSDITVTGALVRYLNRRSLRNG